MLMPHVSVDLFILHFANWVLRVLKTNEQLHKNKTHRHICEGRIE